MRKWNETIKPWPALKTRYPYRTRVSQIEKVNVPKTIVVTLEHLDNGQEGRQEKVVLPRPIKCHGLAAQFFTACGMTIIPNATIAPQDAVGQIILTQFEKNLQSNHWHAVSFTAAHQEDNHVSQ